MGFVFQFYNLIPNLTVRENVRLVAHAAPSVEAQAAKLRGILESAVTAIITIDDRGGIESINRATERLFGYTTAELLGHNVKVLRPEPEAS